VSALRVEEFLARLYVDPEARRCFVAEPRECARRAGLAETDVTSLAALDADDLELAARSFAAKRSRRMTPGRTRWRAWLSRLSRRG
jgi:hypothetical protein